MILSAVFVGISPFQVVPNIIKGIAGAVSKHQGLNDNGSNVTGVNKRNTFFIRHILPAGSVPEE